MTASLVCEMCGKACEAIASRRRTGVAAGLSCCSICSQEGAVHRWKVDPAAVADALGDLDGARPIDEEFVREVCANIVGSQYVGNQASRLANGTRCVAWGFSGSLAGHPETRLVQSSGGCDLGKDVRCAEEWRAAKDSFVGVKVSSVRGEKMLRGNHKIEALVITFADGREVKLFGRIEVARWTVDPSKGLVDGDLS